MKIQSFKELLSKLLILTSLGLIIFAYYPTLTSEFVVQDQWRAFRYSILEKTPSYRAGECIKLIPDYYIATGRPLVWMGECVEHAVVGQIKDFVYLRPFVLGVVLITAIYVGSVIAPLVGGLAMGVGAVSLFVMVPGYSYMYMQGMTAVMVLFSILLTAASFSQLNQYQQRRSKNIKNKLFQIISPAVSFILACMIYPSWAFIVIILAWLRFSFNEEESITKRFWQLAQTIAFYFSISMIYYLAVNSLIVLTGLNEIDLKPLGNHNQVLQLNPEILLDRGKKLVSRFYTMPLLNFQSFRGSSIVLLSLFSLYAAGYVGFKILPNNRRLWLWSGGIFLMSIVILLISLSPWLFSHMDNLATRYLIPWYFFFCVGSIAFIASVTKNLSTRIKEMIPVFVIVFLLLPVAVIQNQYSILETAVSAQEINALRSSFDTWLSMKGYKDNTTLLIVRPQQNRPLFAERILGENNGIGENGMLSSAGNPVTIPWMMAAIVRERNDHPLAKTITMVDCSFDKNCIEFGPREDEVILGITNADTSLQCKKAPFIINLSLLTSKKIYPTIEK